MLKSSSITLQWYVIVSIHLKGFLMIQAYSCVGIYVCVYMVRGAGCNRILQQAYKNNIFRHYINKGTQDIFLGGGVRCMGCFWQNKKTICKKKIVFKSAPLKKKIVWNLYLPHSKKAPNLPKYRGSTLGWGLRVSPSPFKNI